MVSTTTDGVPASPAQALPRPKRFPRWAIVIYPWLIWHLCRLAGYGIARLLPLAGWRRRFGARVAQGAVYLVLGFPVTFVGTAELLISMNELALGEQADYRLSSDFALGVDGTLEIPGPPTPVPAPVSRDVGDTYYTYLAELYAPVFLHKVSFEPHWDVPVHIEFDGNDDPRDNVDSTPRGKAVHAGVYGEVTAETAKAFYLTYSLYHIKDYDHPIRETISDWTFHDNDNEGLMIRVEKATMQVTEAETWFHNRFFICNLTGETAGSEPVQARLHVENDTHLIIYAQSMGHGVRCAQSTDLQSLDTNMKILRWVGDREPVLARTDSSVQVDATYSLKSFDRWYALARGPFGSEGRGPGLFEEEIELGTYPDGTRMVIGRFLAGRDYAKGSWSRPKPMWSWDDGWDDVPIFVWHFFPTHAFESHLGIEVSHDYIYNRPVDKTFGLPPNVVYDGLTIGAEKRKGKKWSSTLEKHGNQLHVDAYWKALRAVVKQYVNYLFNGLG
jgi:hypothetical protein